MCDKVTSKFLRNNLISSVGLPKRLSYINLSSNFNELKDRIRLEMQAINPETMDNSISSL